MKPVLFVTGHVPRDRVGSFAALADLEDVVVARFGGTVAHGPEGTTAGTDPLPFVHIDLPQHEVFRLAASGRYRAVVASNSGRVALGAAWAGARAARIPLLLWTALWAHPRTPVHVASRLALARLYRSADAVVTYGPHVSAYVRARGARRVFEAPQAVDNAFWSAPVEPAGERALANCVFLFAGRAIREKGLQVLLSAWRASGLVAPAAALVLVGVRSIPPEITADGAAALPGVPPTPGRPLCLGPVDPQRLRALYAAADVLVAPSIATRNFREPWGLVANEAMNQGLPVLASDAFGAAAGGLVRDGRNGAVVRAGDVDALAGALARLAADRALRERLGAAAREDVRPFTPQAWAQGFSAALRSVGRARER